MFLVSEVRDKNELDKETHSPGTSCPLPHRGSRKRFMSGAQSESPEMPLPLSAPEMFAQFAWPAHCGWLCSARASRPIAAPTVSQRLLLNVAPSAMPPG